MMEEEWKQWMDVNHSLPMCNVDSISDNMKNLVIMLSDSENREFEVIFESSVEAYRVTNESYRLNTFAMLDKRYGIDFYKNHTIFTIKHSKYIQWLSSESDLINFVDGLTQFTFLGSDEIIDVVAMEEPKIYRK